MRQLNHWISYLLISVLWCTRLQSEKNFLMIWYCKTKFTCTQTNGINGAVVLKWPGNHCKCEWESHPDLGRELELQSVYINMYTHFLTEWKAQSQYTSLFTIIVLNKTAITSLFTIIVLNKTAISYFADYMWYSFLNTWTWSVIF